MATGPRPKNPIRRDPPRRRGFLGFDPTKLTNADPDKRYKLVDPSAKMDGVSQHEQWGWEIVLRSKDGPNLQVGTGAKQAEPVTLYDHVLMSISREEAARVDQEGQYGERGQNILDEIQEQILNPSGIANVRGGDIADVINETKPAQTFVSDSI